MKFPPWESWNKLKGQHKGILCDKLADCSLNRRSTLVIDCIDSVYANLLNSLVDDLYSNGGSKRPKVLSNDQLPWVRLRKIWSPQPDDPEGLVDECEKTGKLAGDCFLDEALRAECSSFRKGQHLQCFCPARQEEGEVFL